MKGSVRTLDRVSELMAYYLILQCSVSPVRQLTQVFIDYNQSEYIVGHSTTKSFNKKLGNFLSNIFFKVDFFLYKSLFSTISLNICQSIHFTVISIKYKIFQMKILNILLLYSVHCTWYTVYCKVFECKRELLLLYD